MRLLFRVLVPALLLICPALAADKDKPAPEPLQAAPAFVDVVTFFLHTDGESRKVIVTSCPGLLRVDEPGEGYSVIYDAATDHYTGLEHRNYTWWEFSWPEVRGVVQASKRYAARLEELNAEGAGNDTSTSLSGTASSVPDNSGYVWRQTGGKKRIAGLDCIQWSGDSVSGEAVQAWCYNGPLPKVQAAMESLRKINEPMALVPIREIVPSIVFPAYDALVKGGVTPVQISWGGNLDKNQFGLVESTTRDGKLSLFTVPKLYVKTTLITMDGLLDPKSK